MAERASFFVLDGPLSASLSVLQTRSAHLKGFSTLVRALGHNPEQILTRYGIDPQAMHNGDCGVDCPSLIEMIGACSSDLNEPLFGLLLAQQQSTHVLGTLDALCRAAPDFRTAITSLCEYLPIAHSPQCQLELVESAGNSEVRLSSHSEFEHLEQMMYGGLYTIVAFLRELGDGEFMPKYVTTRYNTPQESLPALQATLGCQVHSGAADNAIVFATGILDKPLASANRVTFRLLSDYLLRVGGEQRDAIVDRVEDYIRGALIDRCTLPRCAAALGMSARTLQIRLNELDVRFSELVEQARARLAREYICAGNLSLDEVATRLGYAEQTSFGRAFRRWTGQTPGQFKTDPRPAAAM
jgi:AraC-like DNA-binding protein